MQYRKQCRKCQKVFTAKSRLDIADIEVCDACHTSLPVEFEEYDPDKPKVLSDTGFSPDEVRADGENLPVELELSYIGTSIVIQLPRMSGVVGRVPVNCDAIKTFSTISRKQFTYNYLDGGGLEITNSSQYGTVVQGVFLDVDESIVVAPPAIIVMGGCYSFELREKGR